LINNNVLKISRGVENQQAVLVVLIARLRAEVVNLFLIILNLVKNVSEKTQDSAAAPYCTPEKIPDSAAVPSPPPRYHR
jgi:hypothetical protein